MKRELEREGGRDRKDQSGFPITHLLAYDPIIELGDIRFGLQSELPCAPCMHNWSVPLLLALLCPSARRKDAVHFKRWTFNTWNCLSIYVHVHVHVRHLVQPILLNFLAFENVKIRLLERHSNDPRANLIFLFLKLSKLSFHINNKIQSWNLDTAWNVKLYYILYFMQRIHVF